MSEKHEGGCLVKVGGSGEQVKWVGAQVSKWDVLTHGHGKVSARAPRLLPATREESPVSCSVR